MSLIQTNCPVLLLFGDLDVIHPPDKHLEIMERALKKGGNNNVSIKVSPQTNHEFTIDDLQKKKEFIPTLLPTITDWILKTGVK